MFSSVARLCGFYRTIGLHFEDVQTALLDSAVFPTLLGYFSQHKDFGACAYHNTFEDRNIEHIITVLIRNYTVHYE